MLFLALYGCDHNSPVIPTPRVFQLRSIDLEGALWHSARRGRPACYWYLPLVSGRIQERAVIHSPFLALCSPLRVERVGVRHVFNSYFHVSVGHHHVCLQQSISNGEGGIRRTCSDQGWGVNRLSPDPPKIHNSSNQQSSTYICIASCPLKWYPRRSLLHAILTYIRSLEYAYLGKRVGALRLFFPSIHHPSLLPSVATSV